MHKSIVVTALLVAISGAAVPAQTPDVGFEVASVKKVTTPGMIYGIRPIEPSGRFYAIITVRDLIMVAYGSRLALVEAQIIDAPAWTRNDRFEIVAKVAGEFSQNGFVANMRALLAERFQLRVRKETRQLPVYDLVRPRARARRSTGATASSVKRSVPDRPEGSRGRSEPRVRIQEGHRDIDFGAWDGARWLCQRDLDAP